MIPFNDLRAMARGLQSDLEAAAGRVIASGHYLRGRETQAFEEQWAAYCGQRYCVAVANGTDAIQLMALAADLQVVDVPAITCWYTAEGLHRAGCQVRAVDVRSDGHIERPHAGTICTPLYGSLPTAAESAKCRFFDGAQAHGWKPPEQATVAWSFYPTKTLGALGDAGAVTTNDQGLAEQLRMLAGRDDIYRDARQMVSRVDELQAALLSVRLRHLPEWIEQKREVARWYFDLLPYGDRCRMVYLPDESHHYSLAVMADERDRLMVWLALRGITAKAHYGVPLHKHAAPWADAGRILPVAERWCDRTLSLPCYPGLLRSEVQAVCEAISEFYKAHS